MSSETAFAEPLRAENARLHQELREAKELLDSICKGRVDALVVERESTSEIAYLASAQEFFWSAIEDSGALGRFSWDYAAQSCHLSAGLARMYGLGETARPISEQAWLAHIHPADRAMWEARRTGRDESCEFRHEFRIARADGQVRWLEARGRVRRDSRGQVAGLVAVQIDVSEQKRTEAELKQLNETLEQQIAERTAEADRRAAQLQAMAIELTWSEERERRRLAHVLHDHLQQLLVTAKMRSAMLLRRIEDPARSDELRKIDELLNESITESRSLSVELSPPVLYDSGLAAAVSWLARRMEDQYQLTIVDHADPEADPADEGTRVLLFQAVRELLFNTVKHSQAHFVEVRLARADAGRVRLEVRDNGVGFDVESLDRGSVGEGGFGLFSIRERLKAIDGDMLIESQPGHGTCVALIAPLERVQAATAESPAAATTTASLLPSGSPAAGKENAIRVLLADDHPILRKGLADVLSEHPEIDVIAQADNGQDAVGLAIALQPDVVLMDVNMPRLSGTEATRRIVREVPRARVIALSMYDDEDVAQAMCSAGAAAYLSKTVGSAALVERILTLGRRPAGGR